MKRKMKTLYDYCITISSTQKIPHYSMIFYVKFSHFRFRGVIKKREGSLHNNHSHTRLSIQANVIMTKNITLYEVTIIIKIL